MVTRAGATAHCEITPREGSPTSFQEAIGRILMVSSRTGARVSGICLSLDMVAVTSSIRIIIRQLQHRLEGNFWDVIENSH